MNPILKRTLIFITLVAAAMFIILAVASVSHAAESRTNARAVWDDKPTSISVTMVRKHVHRKHRKGVRPIVSGTSRHGRSFDQKPTVDVRPQRVGAVHWQHPWHAELYEQFEDWLYFGKR